ncbi:PREDICTED: uncharacterized protein LOC108565771 isoform X2 [Nicrophorus vespilloides]|uniref:Uncharacterized protein LOC108565771 isoform X2 n=1 Tax=Nicrophorus vespilloides TaxID=110193 RepID=A0ABM1N219_NICVS|nr:PREDICTED: uncharacterized protein LOC108565771 isoform X2 [Nicrophorus vespilloides]
MEIGKKMKEPAENQKRNLGLAMDSNPKKKKKLDVDQSAGKILFVESGNSRIPRVKRKRVVKFDDTPMDINDEPQECYEKQQVANSPISEILMKMERDLHRFCRRTAEHMEKISEKLHQLEENNSAMYAECMNVRRDLRRIRSNSDVVSTPNLRAKNLRMPTTNRTVSNGNEDRSMAEAVRLYNHLNDGFGSPVTDRANLQTPDHSSKKYMAIKLQKQCLMLCETPTSNK